MVITINPEAGGRKCILLSRWLYVPSELSGACLPLVALKAGSCSFDLSLLLLTSCVPKQACPSPTFFFY